MEIFLSLFLVIRSFPTNNHRIITTTHVYRYAHKKQLTRHETHPVRDLFATVSVSILRCFWVHREQNSLAVYVYACAQLFLVLHNLLPRREHRNSGNKEWP